MNPQITNGGAFIAPTLGISPQAPTSSGTAIKGSAIDRLGYGSAVLSVAAGASSGSPSSFSVAGKIQHSDTTTDGDFTDFTGGAITPITAVDTLAKVNVDLTGAKRYIRAVVTPTYVGGSSPYVFVGAQVVLAGSSNPPTT